jgi:DNA repair exonuclease SbcCD nuclease subunit
MVRFLHTADWQLGAQMSQASGDKGAFLRQERVAAIDRLRVVAEQHEVDFVVAAGDLYDAHTVDNTVVTRSLEILGRFPCPVYAIPGNHDFARAPESVYQRDRFVSRCPDQFILLAPCPVPGQDATILPCPLLTRHTAADPTRWLATPAADTDPSHIRIGLAHGSVLRFDSEDGGTTPNLIDPGIVEVAALDYLALGDWHGLKQVNSRAWYSGTPEPDRFKDNQSGHVLLVEIDVPSALPKVTPIACAACTWLTRGARLHTREDVDELQAWFEALDAPRHTLVRLEYSGILGLHDLTRLNNLLETQADLLLELRSRGDGVRLQPRDAELASLGGDGLTGRVAGRLRKLVSEEGEQADIASLALQILFQHAGPADAGGQR